MSGPYSRVFLHVGLSCASQIAGSPLTAAESVSSRVPKVSLWENNSGESIGSVEVRARVGEQGGRPHTERGRKPPQGGQRVRIKDWSLPRLLVLCVGSRVARTALVGSA